MEIIRNSSVSGFADYDQIDGISTCRILLTEDDPEVRARIVGLISTWTAGQLVSACPDLCSTLDVIKRHRVDLLITDLNLPDGNGIEAIRALAEIQPNACAMVISVLKDEHTVLEAIEAGASGYLLKDSDSHSVVEAIRDVMEGRSPISPRIARILVDRLSLRKQFVKNGQRLPKLTDREMDILWGMAKGFTSAEIAERLGIARQTVHVHIRNIYRKLQVSNRSEAVFEASKQGLIRL